MGKFIDLTGQRFGKLTVIKRIENDKYKNARWLCRCDCGNENKVTTNMLRRGNSKSCGCLSRDMTSERNLTHGMTKTPEYSTWISMKTRCYNKKFHAYKHYGGRGITVCDRWLKSFDNFYEDMGPKPTPEHSIDRIDNNKGYSPGNCKWVTINEQANNRRNNHNITLDCTTKTISQWGDEIGINSSVISLRLRRGWDSEKALTTPIKKERLITFNNKTLTINEWSKETGIDVKNLYNRLKLGWPIEKVLTQPVRKERYITFNGKTQTLTEWAKEIGINVGTLDFRLRCGWTPEKALTTQVRKHKQKEK